MLSDDKCNPLASSDCNSTIALAATVTKEAACDDLSPESGTADGSTVPAIDITPACSRASSKMGSRNTSITHRQSARRFSLATKASLKLIKTESLTPHGKHSLPTEGIAEVLERHELFKSEVSGIFHEEVIDELEADEKKLLLESIQGQALQALLFAVCAVMGSLVPLVSQYTKEKVTSYPDMIENVCIQVDCGNSTDRGCGQYKLPFHPSVQIVIESIFSLTIGLIMTAVLSGKQGLDCAFNFGRLRMTAPIAGLYALGDLMQLIVISNTSAEFFLLVAQLKLMSTAIVTRLILGRGQTVVQWLLLAVITIVVILFCKLDMQHKHFGTLSHESENPINAVLFSVFRVVSGALCGVLLERAMKAAPSEPIWVNQVQLKVVSVPFAMFFCVVTGLNDWYSDNPCTSLLETGPFNGMGFKVSLLIATQAVQNFIVGLVYKTLNAISKYLASAQSLWITYLLSVFIKGTSLYEDVTLAVAALVLLVIAYSLAKASPPTQAIAEAKAATPQASVEMSQMRKA